jgi:hypothetical protein
MGWVELFVAPSPPELPYPHAVDSISAADELHCYSSEHDGHEVAAGERFVGTPHRLRHMSCKARACRISLCVPYRARN